VIRGALLIISGVIAGGVGWEPNTNPNNPRIRVFYVYMDGLGNIDRRKFNCLLIISGG